MGACKICERPKADVCLRDYDGPGEAYAGGKATGPVTGQLETCDDCHKDIEDSCRPKHNTAASKKNDLLLTRPGRP